jgi:bifunctional DNA primase/polymerase-like protein
VAVTAGGLPVVPGAWWCMQERRFDCDRPGCARSGPHPVPGLFAGPTAAGGLLAGAVRKPQEAAARWRTGPYAVLLPTGEACDVVDVPARLGRTALARLEQRLESPRTGAGPVIAAGPRWFFLTAAGGELPSPAGDVLVHGQGSWIMLPPSLGPGGQPAVWVVRPRGRGWVRGLPLRDEVIRALGTAARPRLRRLPTLITSTPQELPASA